MKNAYEIPIDANDSTIKKAYLKKSKLEHPDKNGNTEEANIKFQKIAEAYQTLLDPNARMKHDIEHSDNILLPGNKKVIMQLLKKLDEEVNEFINSLPKLYAKDPKYTESNDRINLLKGYKDEIQYTMEKTYKEQNSSKLYEPLQGLMQKAKTAAENSLIAEAPKSSKFFARIINSIKNCFSTFFPSLKVENKSTANAKIINHFHQMEKKFNEPKEQITKQTKPQNK